MSSTILAARSAAAQIVANDVQNICDRLSTELPMLAGKGVLITGGAGFLGHYLVQAIAHFNRTRRDRIERIRLTVYDNFSRGIPAWLTKLEHERALTVVTHDMTHALPPDVGSFEYIMHAASIASPTFYRQHPIQTMDANVNGLRHLLDYFRRRKQRGLGVEGFVFFSSSEIYGDPDPANIPTPEAYRGLVSCTGPRACYDEAKRYGETLCVNFAQQFDLPVKIVRPFNNYGPGLKITDGRVIPDFARDVLAGRDIVMLSDGSATRTFCYVADAVVGYLKVLVRGRSGEAYNIGTEEPEISVADLAIKIADTARESFGYKGQVVFRRSNDKDYLIDNPTRRCPVIAKARQDVGFAPEVQLDDGLRRALTWYADNREAEAR